MTKRKSRTIQARSNRRQGQAKGEGAAAARQSIIWFAPIAFSMRSRDKTNIGAIEAAA